MEVLLRVSYPLTEVVQIPHTSLLALAGKSPEVSLFDVDSKQIVARIETGVRELHALSVTPDGRFLAVGGATVLPDDVSRPVLIELASRTCRVLDVPGPARLGSCRSPLCRRSGLWYEH